MPTNSTQTGGSVATHPNGMTASYTKSNQTLFAGQVPLIDTKVSTPSGLVRTETNSASFAITNNDPNTIVWTDNKDVNGSVFKSIYDRALKKQSSISPLGRTSYSTHDAKGNVIQAKSGTLTAANFTYDARARLTGVTQGSRAYAFAYDAKDRLLTSTDPLNRNVSYTYDAVGRVLSKTLPDNRTASFTYDAGGNMRSLTTPSNSTHVFSYSAVDLTESYIAPAINANSAITNYYYDLDKRITRIARPDASAINFAYDAKGRLSTIIAPTGAINYAFNDATGSLTSISGPYGVTSAFTYDGTLPKSETWSGVVTGSTSYTYDNFFRVVSQSVNGTNQVNFSYDADGLLTGAGALAITRDAQNGFVTTENIGSVARTQSYNGYGEVTGTADAFGGTQFLRYDYALDNAGRISAKTETSGTTTHVYSYAYDQAGRLVGVATDNATTAQYTYDANSNRTAYVAQGVNANATYDAQDRLLTYGDNTYSYTANG